MSNTNYPTFQYTQAPNYNNTQPISNNQIGQHNLVYPQENYVKQQMIQPVQYPTLATTKDSVSTDEIQQERIISHDYLQEQQQPQQIVYIQPQQLNTPFIQQIVYEEVELTQQERRLLIRSINGLWIFQQCLQITLSIVNMASYSYDNLFYNFEKQTYRPTLYVFLALTFGFLLIVRFSKKLWRIRGRQFGLYALYTFLYSFFSSGLVSAGHESFEYSKSYFLFGFLYFIGTFGVLIVLIQFQFQIKKFEEENMTLKNFILSVLSGPITILFVITALFGIDVASVVLAYLVIWSIVFTCFYVNSLLQVYRGKFKLRQEQMYVGCILVYINMLIPCI